MESTTSSIADSLDNDLVTGGGSGGQDMTEDEVNKMVQEALQRARRAMMSRTSRIGEESNISSGVSTKMDNDIIGSNTSLGIVSCSLDDDDRIGYDTKLSAKLDAIRNTISTDSNAKYDDTVDSFDMTNEESDDKSPLDDNKVSNEEALDSDSDSYQSANNEINKEDSEDEEELTSKLNDLKLRNDIISQQSNITPSSIIQMAENEAKHALLLAAQYKAHKHEEETNYLENEVYKISNEVNQLVYDTNKQHFVNMQSDHTLTEHLQVDHTDHESTQTDQSSEECIENQDDDDKYAEYDQQTQGMLPSNDILQEQVIITASTQSSTSSSPSNNYSSFDIDSYIPYGKEQETQQSTPLKENSPKESNTFSFYSAEDTKAIVEEQIVDQQIAITDEQEIFQEIPNEITNQPSTLSENFSHDVVDYIPKEEELVKEEDHSSLSANDESSGEFTEETVSEDETEPLEELKAVSSPASIQQKQEQTSLDQTNANIFIPAQEIQPNESTDEESNQPNALSPVQQVTVNKQFDFSPLPSPVKPSPQKQKSRQIELRNPYPLPPPARRPRSPNTIIKEHLKPISPINIKWLNPSQQLTELLKAAKGNSVARRSNACGALKVLAARNKENQKKLARTYGVLDALVYAANQSPLMNNSDNAFDARTRAVATILHLSTPVINRTLILTHEGLAECLVKVMREDYGEARVNACSALALLAKTPENRGFMIKVPNLPETIAEVISGKRKYVTEPKKKNVHSDEDEDNDEDSSVGSSTFDGSSAESSYDESESQSSSYLHESIKEDTTITDTANAETKATAVKSNNNIIYDCRPIHLKRCVEYLDAARLNSCAILTHLVKYCPVSNLMCNFKVVIDTLVKVSLEFTSPVHTRCIEILCHLTRFQYNNTFLAKNKQLIDTLISCGKSKENEDRLWSLRALQNLTSDAKSKLHLATTNLLTLLSVSAMRKDEDEQVAAVGSLLNLSTESANIVPLTNTKSVLATLVHLAHNPNSSFEVRRMACNTLSNISLWLQTLAGKGTVPEDVDKVLLPSNDASGWQRWE